MKDFLKMLIEELYITVLSREVTYWQLRTFSSQTLQAIKEILQKGEKCETLEANNGVNHPNIADDPKTVNLSIENMFVNRIVFLNTNFK